MEINQDVALQLARRFAPLVRVFSIDPPADASTWLVACDLVEYDTQGIATVVCPATERSTWPDGIVEQFVRPHANGNASGFAFAPRQLFPKILHGADHAFADGRQIVRDGQVSAPCFYEFNAIETGHRLTYWFFFPTSAMPKNDFSLIIPLLVDAFREQNIRPDELPPLCATVERGRVDQFWDRVATSSSFGNRMVESMRAFGRPGNTLGLMAAQAFNSDTRKLLATLDPLEQERMLSFYVHEGDWEGISVDLDTHLQPLRLLYWAHGAPIVFARDQTPVVTVEDEQRFAVLVALGSHASLPDLTKRNRPTGKAALEEEELPCSDSPTWRTWTDLRSAQLEPWYGFGGAWGRARMMPLGGSERRTFPGNDKDLWIESTGPLGPSILKAAANADSLKN